MGINKTTVMALMSFVMGTVPSQTSNMISKGQEPSGPSVVYIDGNSLIHHKLQTAIPASATSQSLFNEKSMNKMVDQVKDSLITQVNELYLQNRPFSKLVLVFDGPCPFAKNTEQRKRRFANPSSLVASPGTYFMFKLSQCLYQWSVDTFYAYSKKGEDLQVEFSDCFVEGEGELKILKSMMDFEKKEGSNYRHVVYTKDSDFILLLLACSVEDIVLINDFQRIEKKLLKNKIKMQFGGHNESHINKIMLDIVLLCITFGNDYLEPLPHENKLLNLLLRYKKKKLKQKYVGRFLFNLDGNKASLDLEFLIKVLVKSKDAKTSQSSAKEVAETRNYMTSLLWCMSAYAEGCCKDYGFSPHCKPPMLMSHLIQDIKNMIASGGKMLTYNTEGTSSLIPVTFLLSIMPYTVFKQNIPKNILGVIEKDRSIIVDFMNHVLQPEHFGKLKQLEGKLAELKQPLSSYEDSEIWMEKLLGQPQTFIVSKERLSLTYLTIGRLFKQSKKKC